MSGREGRAVAPAATARLDTFPKYLIQNAATRGSRTAIRLKDLGIWQSWTWAEVLVEVRRFAIGLADMGIGRGDRVAIVGRNRPRLYWAMVAVQSLGGVPVPVYADSVADEMSYVLNHAEVKAAVVQDQEQVDKVLSISDRLPTLGTIIYDYERGLRDYDHSRLKSFSDVQKAGDQVIAADPTRLDAWRQSVEAGTGGDLCVILYTSGTTGKPKGVMLSNDNVVVSAINGNAFDKLDETEETVAYLPLAWVGDFMFSVAQSYTAGFCVNCPENPDTVTEDRREIAPTYFFAPPRVYETLLTLTMVRMEDAGSWKRRMFHSFIEHARLWGEKILNGEAVPFSAKLKYQFGEWLVYGPLKNRMGLTRLKIGYTAGEAIGPEIFRFYRSLGLNLKQLYGQTEASVYITAQPDGEIHADTVGKPNIGVEIRIDENGEVQFNSPGVFRGYYKDPDKTAETKTADGWVRTGDAGFFDSATGHLRIIDRAKDVGKLASGALFAPKYIENKLKFYPNIKEVVAFGQGRDYATAFINIDLTAVGSWAERNNVIYSSYQELAAHPQVYGMIAVHVEEVNRSLAAEPIMAGAQIKRFLILPKELDADDGELTRTQKVRRGFIADRYQSLIDGLYSDAKEASIRTEVTFEDGRKGLIAATVAIRDVTTTPVPQRTMEKAA
jgi:long-chain acyl-CoA synthetase